MRKIDFAAWPRRAHYEFYKDYTDPFWNVTVQLDATELVRRCREPGGPSFFLSSLWLAMRAIDGVEELRLRIRGGDVVLLDRTHPGCTILREDETFGFGYFEMVDDYTTFEQAGKDIVEQVRATEGALDDRPERDDLVYCSVLPWLAFTSFRHARRGQESDSIPRLVLGRHHEQGGRLLLPVSIEAHHALVDGLHVGRFVKRFEAELADLPPGLASMG